jgi:hypothetical protein
MPTSTSTVTARSRIASKNFSGGTVYSYSAALTYRPGVLVKFNEDFGMDNSLEYGFWYERSRKSQAESYGLSTRIQVFPATCGATPRC